jgi:hypothetical protein
LSKENSNNKFKIKSKETKSKLQLIISKKNLQQCNKKINSIKKSKKKEKKLKFNRVELNRLKKNSSKKKVNKFNKTIKH